MSQNSLSALEAAWQTLRVSLEGANEFGLVFVFCDDAALKEALFRRADDLMRTQVKPFQRPSRLVHTDDLKKYLLAAAINPSQALDKMGLPLWLDADGRAGDADWDTARLEFLYRLNERRAKLVQQRKRPVILALPLDWTKRAAEAAPDLWTIRQPSIYLQSTDVAAAPAGSASIGEPAPLSDVQPPAQASLPLVVQRWQASQASGHDISVWDGGQASDAAFEAGHIELAWEIARQSIQSTQTHLENQGRTPERLRDLSISRNKLGDIAQALGRLDEAQSAFAEGEKLSRELIDGYGKTPERLRDLSISMEKLGSIAIALGRLNEAQSAFETQVTVAQDLLRTYGDSVGGLEVWAYAQMRLGQLMLGGPNNDRGRELLRFAQQTYQRLALAMPHDERYAAAVAAIDAVAYTPAQT